MQELISAAHIQQRIVQLGEEIRHAYADAPLVLLGVLNGAFIFTADLCRAIPIACEIDFIRVASYGADLCSSGRIELVQPPRLSLVDKHVLVVEDIVDTGVTMRWLMEYLPRYGPRSLRICALIDKTERRKVEVAVDFVGFSLDHGFLVGYGLDVAEQYRNLNAIFSLDEHS